MVRKFVVYKNEMHEVDSFLEGREQWEKVVTYEDYAALEQHYAECHAAWLDAYEVNKDLQRRIDVLQRDLEHIQRGERGSW